MGPSSYTFKSLNHDHAVTADDHHANFISLVPVDLNGVIEHKVHKLIETSKNSNDDTVGVELDVELPVHILLQIRRLS